MGHKTLVILLVQAGADQTLKDYRLFYGDTHTLFHIFRNEIAEQKCNGEALHGFYELRGLRFTSHISQNVA